MTNKINVPVPIPPQSSSPLPHSNGDTFPIQHDIPVPPRYHSKIAATLALLQPGDSFDVPLGSARNAPQVSGYANNVGIHVLTRKLSLPDGSRVLRVWRIE